MIESEALKNDLHVVYRSNELVDGDVRPVRLLGQDLVIRRSAGRAVAWLDYGSIAAHAFRSVGSRQMNLFVLTMDGDTIGTANAPLFQHSLKIQYPHALAHKRTNARKSTAF